MRYLTFLIVGLVAACPHPAWAEEPSEPRNQEHAEQPNERDEVESRSPPTDDKQAPTQLPQELEDIRRALGPDYSIDNWQPEVRDDPSRWIQMKNHQQHGHVEQDGAPPLSDVSEKQQALSREIRSLGGEFRQTARRLESLSADAEEAGLYPMADRLRELARRQWESAREVIGPTTHSAPYNPPQPDYGPTKAHAPGFSFPFPSRYAPPERPGNRSPWRDPAPASPQFPRPDQPHVDGQAPR